MQARLLRAPRTRDVGGQPAQALLEFAFTVTALSLLLAGVVDFARVFYYDVVVSAAANAGVNAAAAGAPDADVVTAAQNSAPSGLVCSSCVTVSPAASSRTAGLTPVWTTVRVQYTFVPITPMISTLIGSQSTFERYASQRMRSSCTDSSGNAC